MCVRLGHSNPTSAHPLQAEGGDARPLLVGEWGGLMENKDWDWQQAFIKYLTSRPIAGSFYCDSAMTAQHSNPCVPRV